MLETARKPITVKGKYNDTLVYAKALETVCENKIRQYLDHPDFSDTNVRVMPDVHISNSTVVGWTSTYASLIIPSIIGYDIGCGVCAFNLGKGKLAFDKLDKFIRQMIPSGQDVRLDMHDDIEEVNAIASRAIAQFASLGHLMDEIARLSAKQGHSPERAFFSLGTLGGGNHFIEIDQDESQNRWLLIHSGSRIFGARIAEFHTAVALRETDTSSTIKYLSGDCAEDYLKDLEIAQYYAKLNRAIMAKTIVEGFFKLEFAGDEYWDCMHNFVDTENSVIRKGAISAKKDEKIIIPFSMAEGAALGRGKGNAEWNYSAPHGSGRKKSRTDAKGLSLDEYRKEMKGVWSSVVGKDTLEESPMAYKKPKDVLDYIADMVEVEKRLKPVYNFKAAE